MYYIQGYSRINPTTMEEVFGIVAPSQGYPYITRHENGALWRMCRHHSHQYRLSDDFKTATLVARGDAHATMMSPEKVTLSEAMRANLKAIIESGNLYDSD